MSEKQLRELERFEDLEKLEPFGTSDVRFEIVISDYCVTSIITNVIHNANCQIEHIRKVDGGIYLMVKEVES
jgi:hypothetical protein